VGQKDIVCGQKGGEGKEKLSVICKTAFPPHAGKTSKKGEGGGGSMPHEEGARDIKKKKP